MAATAETVTVTSATTVGTSADGGPSAPAPRAGAGEEGGGGRETRPATTVVHRHNVRVVLPYLRQLAARAECVALDLEFTGLGVNPLGGRNADMPERYANWCALVRSHAMVSIGLCVVVRVPDGQAPPAAAATAGGDLPAPQGPVYRMHNFSIAVLQATDFTVSPSSLLFLADHGFDLNHLVRAGIPFVPVGGARAGAAAAQTTDGVRLQRAACVHPAGSRGDAETRGRVGRGSLRGLHMLQSRPRPLLEDVGDQTDALQAILEAVRRGRGPLVVHNGLLDLVFLYHALINTLPASVETFLADLSVLFPAGVFDTKYVAEFHQHETRSFLSYLYRKSERAALQPPLRTLVAPAAVLPSALDGAVLERVRREHADEARRTCGQGTYCQFYANHGFCRLGRLCAKSHDLDRILDDEAVRASPRSQRKRARPAAPEAGSASSGSGTAAGVGAETAVTDGDVFHAASYDAYMTAFIFLTQRQGLSDARELESLANKMYAMGKPYPLLLRTSPFIKPSAVVTALVQ